MALLLGCAIPSGEQIVRKLNLSQCVGGCNVHLDVCIEDAELCLGYCEQEYDSELEDQCARQCLQDSGGCIAAWADCSQLCLKAAEDALM